MKNAVTPGELILKNAKIVTPEVLEGGVHVRGDAIADISRRASRIGGRCGHRGGNYLLPGLIDLHADNFERHVRPRNNADWPAMAALLAHHVQMISAGITTIFDSLSLA